MTRHWRRLVFAISAAALASVFFLAYRQLPPLGYAHSPYGDTVNAIVVPERHTTDAVTAVNFDVRGFDTLGEEFILFASVMGVVVLMRRQKDDSAGDHEDHVPDRIIPTPSDAVRVTSLLLLGPTVLFGLYMVTHGQTTPGGGFQGGVILSSAPLLLYLCAEYRPFLNAVPKKLVERSESFGAAVYIMVGGACLLFGGLFLQNVLPLGASGTVTSGGTIILIDLGVGLEVSGGLTLAFLSYLEELVEQKEQ